MGLDNQIEMVRNAVLADIDKSKEIVFKGLLDNPMVNRLPETVFVNYFLPHFLGRGHNPNWVMEWISIAGTPMAEVAVFKDGTNDILFNVPSLLYTNNLFMHKNAGNLGDIFGRYEQINNNMPQSGLSFLLSALNSKNNELLANFNMQGANSVWLHIFQRYNLIEHQTDITGNAPAQVANLNDFLDF